MGNLTKLQRPDAEVDQLPRFVRVTDWDHNGLVEFQFSVGDPHLFLEMILPPQAFAEFRRAQAAVFLTEAEGRAVDAAERRWRFGDDEEG
jgi:phenol hydroxylase P0 protein